MAATHQKERELTREITRKVEDALPGTEVLAVELASPERFTVYIDHAQGVDHALCERVTNVLRDYLRDFSVDVSSPGLARPLRRREHFRQIIGRHATLKTGAEIARRRNFKGEIKDAGERAVTVGVDGNDVDIPYEAIVRGNLIDEG